MQFARPDRQVFVVDQPAHVLRARQHQIVDATGNPPLDAVDGSRHQFEGVGIDRRNVARDAGNAERGVVEQWHLARRGKCLAAAFIEEQNTYGAVERPGAWHHNPDCNVAVRVLFLDQFKDAGLR